MSESKFCVKCGANLPAGAQFCNQCGAIVTGTEAEKKAEEERTEMEKMMRESRMHWLMFFFIIYAIPAFLMGLTAMMNAGATVETLWKQDFWIEFLKTHPDITKDFVIQQVKIVAGMSMASGLLAGVSAFCVIKRRFWILATICSFIATILCVWNIFGIIIGFFVSWMTISSREDFYNDLKPEGQ